MQHRANIVLPGEVIGIIGGGQLGRMMALRAKFHGFRVWVLDPTSDCPAAQVADYHVQAEYGDVQALQQMASHCSVLTYEFENVDAVALQTLDRSVCSQESIRMLQVTQHRLEEKRFIAEHGARTAQYRGAHTVGELYDAVQTLGLPCVLKTAQGGYDGHGQAVLRTMQDVHRAAQTWHTDYMALAGECDDAGETGERCSTGFGADALAADAPILESVVEQFVDFAYEASVLVAGNGADVVVYPLVRNIHVNNILHMTLAQAQLHEHEQRVQAQAQAMARSLAHGFALAGVLAIELFVLTDGTVLVNEMAPRPHNSGHYTIEACSMDQFDAHIRGCAGWPLPEVSLLSDAVMVNILGQHQASIYEQIADHPEWHLHDYGKTQARHNRKMGHITVLCDDAIAAARRLQSLEPYVHETTLGL